MAKYIYTILELGAGGLEADIALSERIALSQAVSLKRIADMLEKLYTLALEDIAHDKS